MSLIELCTELVGAFNILLLSSKAYRKSPVQMLDTNLSDAMVMYTENTPK